MKLSIICGSAIVGLLLLTCSSPLEVYNLYQPIVLDFTGPEVAEDDSDNPYTSFRLEAVFTDVNGLEYNVPGFFAADGEAAETSASSGDVWRVKWSPPTEGKWSYVVKMYQGDNAYLQTISDLEEVDISGSTSGSFQVTYHKSSSDKDLANLGRLQYDGTHYLKWSHTDNPYIKGGANSPENFLAFKDFDGTYSSDSSLQFLKTWEPHVKDWRSGDPTWQEGKGKGIIGSINYLSEKGMNSLYMLTMNIKGDGRDVWPYTSHQVFDRFDVSKLAQWDIVFAHAQSVGVAIQFVLQETENETLLDSGDTGPMRQLYYRELLARFGYLNALTWNLGEENGPAEFTPVAQTDEQRKAMTDWFDDHDSYDHPIFLHTHSWPAARDPILDPLYGYKPLDGLSMQVDDPMTVHDVHLGYYEKSKASDHPWVLHMDEIGKYWKGAVPDKDEPDHDTMRIHTLWGSLMAGGAGVEWYFGYKYDEADLNCEDWRSRDGLWDQTKEALEVFNYMSVDKMSPMDHAIEGDAWCLGANGVGYIIYLPKKAPIMLDLSDDNNSYLIHYRDAATGTGLPTPGSDRIWGGRKLEIEMPPFDELDDIVITLTYPE